MALGPCESLLGEKELQLLEGYEELIDKHLQTSRDVNRTEVVVPLGVETMNPNVLRALTERYLRVGWKKAQNDWRDDLRVFVLTT